MKLVAKHAGFLLVVLAGSGLRAAAQKSAPQQSVTVVVVDAHADPSKPVAAVGVSLSYVDSGTRVTDARDVTNPKGEAYLQVSPDAPQRGDLRVEISGTTSLVIYQPADGQLEGLGSRVTVKLLPKGSPTLLGPAQIEAMLHRTLLQLNSQQKQIQALKNQKPDLSAALAEVAQVYGFAPADFDRKVQQWAQGVQADPAADVRKRGLAEVAQKHYAEAAQLFGQAVGADEAALDGAAPDSTEVRHRNLRRLFQDSSQGASALQLNLQFHTASFVVEVAKDRIAAEQERYPRDQALHEMLRDANLADATAHSQEGIRTAAKESLPLLSEAVQEFRSLAPQYLAAGDRTNWARTQSRLGDALDNEGERAAGDEAAAFFEQAEKAYRSALDVYTKTDLPQDWARAQIGLGNALDDEGERAAGDIAVALFDRAEHAYRNALEVYTKADTPQDWAHAQDDLGILLTDEGERAAGEKAAALFDQAVHAYGSALEVQTKADLPQEWAGTQIGLGNALSDEGARTVGDEATLLFGRAEQAYRNALEVYTKADLPQDWASAQDDLGIVLQREGEHTVGYGAVAFYEEAEQAYRNALEVYTRADLPQDWARIQNSLGNALKGELEHEEGSAAVAVFDQSVQAYRSALEVRTKADLPQEWATTEHNLGGVLLVGGERLDGNRAAALFDQAVQAYRSALEVRTKTGDPYHWARTMRNLARVYKDQGNAAAAQQALDEANAVDPPRTPPLMQK